jgi:hypothetical protein
MAGVPFDILYVPPGHGTSPPLLDAIKSIESVSVSK